MTISMRWLYKQIIQQKLQHIPESNNCLVWRNTKIIISQTAGKSMGKYKAFTQNKRLKIWDDEIKLTVQQKKQAYKKYLQTKTINNETEYKHRRATAKR